MVALLHSNAESSDLVPAPSRALVGKLHDLDVLVSGQELWLSAATTGQPSVLSQLLSGHSLLAVKINRQGIQLIPEPATGLPPFRVETPSLSLVSSTPVVKTLTLTREHEGVFLLNNKVLDTLEYVLRSYSKALQRESRVKSYTDIPTVQPSPAPGHGLFFDINSQGEMQLFSTGFIPAATPTVEFAPDDTGAETVTLRYGDDERVIITPSPSGPFSGTLHYQPRQAPVSGQTQEGNHATPAGADSRTESSIVSQTTGAETATNSSVIRVTATALAIQITPSVSPDDQLLAGLRELSPDKVQKALEQGANPLALYTQKDAMQLALGQYRKMCPYVPSEEVPSEEVPSEEVPGEELRARTRQIVIALLKEGGSLMGSYLSTPAEVPLLCLLQKEWDEDDSLRQAMLNWCHRSWDSVTATTYCFGNIMFTLCYQPDLYSVKAFQWFKDAGADFDRKECSGYEEQTLLLELLSDVSSQYQAENRFPIILFLLENSKVFHDVTINRDLIDCLLQPWWDDYPCITEAVADKIRHHLEGDEGSFNALVSQCCENEWYFLEFLLKHHANFSLTEFKRLKVWADKCRNSTCIKLIKENCLAFGCLNHLDPVQLAKYQFVLQWFQECIEVSMNPDHYNNLCSYHWIKTSQSHRNALFWSLLACPEHFPEFKSAVWSVCQKDEKLRCSIQDITDLLLLSTLTDRQFSFHRLVPCCMLTKPLLSLWLIAGMGQPVPARPYLEAKDAVDLKSDAGQEIAFLSGCRELMTLQHHCLIFIVQDRAFFTGEILELLSDAMINKVERLQGRMAVYQQQQKVLESRPIPTVSSNHPCAK